MTAESWLYWLCGKSGDGEPPFVCPGCGAGKEAGWGWRIVEYAENGATDMVDNHQEGHDLGVDLRTFGLGRDLILWLEGEGRPTEGVQVLDSVYLLSDGPDAEYGMVLWRTADGRPHVWTAWQYRHLWSDQRALEELEKRAERYERRAAETRDFLARARLVLAGEEP